MSSRRYDESRNWYAIHTYSGYEEKVAESIRQRINGVDMADKIFDCMVPKEKQIQIKNGKRKVVDEKIVQYQIITPTAWNGSPRDSNGNRGAWEEALLGTPIKDPANPVEAGHVVRSFDPCMVCAVHTVKKASERGNTA